MKTLCQCVLEGHFTRETLSKVLSWNHETWESQLNHIVRKNPTKWDVVQRCALHFAEEHLKTYENKQLEAFLKEYKK